MTEAQGARPGDEQPVPPPAPPGMYFDPASGLFLPRGVRLASRGQVADAWFLGLALFIVTLGIGYITWSLFTWGQGRSPAQRMLGLRCWLPEPRRVAGREQTALRQITGFCLNGQLLSGFFIWLTGQRLRSTGDFFAGTVLLHDPDGVLPANVNGEDRPRYAASLPDNKRAGNRPPTARTKVTARCLAGHLFSIQASRATGCLSWWPRPAWRRPPGRLAPPGTGRLAAWH